MLTDRGGVRRVPVRSSAPRRAPPPPGSTPRRSRYSRRGSRSASRGVGPASSLASKGEKGGIVDTDTARLGAYLRGHRDRLRPDEVGLGADGRRRVSGLRRQEVAVLAGISPDYYLRLEQGKDRRPSAQVLDALARAFRLDADGRDYLFRLGGHAAPRRSPGWAQAGPTPAQVGSLTSMVSSWTTTPAYVVDRYLDLVAVNELGRLFLPLACEQGTNMIEAVVDAAALETDAERHEDWDRTIAVMTAALRFHSDPADPRLRVLVASLGGRSRVFRRVWASQEAYPLREGSSPVRVDPFGFIAFRWQTLEVHGGDHFLTSFFGAPGSAAAAAIDFIRARHRVEECLREGAILDA
ncbi:XRE family transcriptional regulator [Rathayibacter sp. AY1E9]|nr:XRE family transcriptional regulator [Rathayibacter sp. AY1E9]PPG58084.1 XRE family transcriptional regulator [Rathayibacter sp. AY1C5]PPH40944.1 XRE family transcriptional regulator [Rathayibacter sp. AY1E4]